MNPAQSATECGRANSQRLTSPGTSPPPRYTRLATCTRFNNRIPTKDATRKNPIMKIIIVGAGITGLSLAIALAQKRHSVLVLESAPTLAEIGAGIQMTPQAVKYLFRWGLKEDILEKSIVYQRMWIKDGRSGEIIGRVPMSDMEGDYGAPYIVVHRAALHDILHRHAVKAGADIRVNSRVVQYDFENGALILSHGERLEADLIVACDGINSFARSQLLKELDPGTHPTGWAAFRLTAEVSKIKADPMTAGLVDLDTCDSNFWCAPDVSCMTYLVKGATILNIVLSHRDQVDTSNYTQEEYKKTVKDLFRHFEPSIQRLLDICAPTIVNYPVYATPPLPHWTHESGRFTLAGDAAHAMAFYLSMGVSLAVEDAVGLCAAIDLATTTENKTTSTSDETDLRKALSVFEKVRKRRAEAVQDASLNAGNVIHMPGSERREKLYESIAYSEKNAYWKPGENAERDYVYGIADKEIRDWCYGYDVEADVRDEWNRRAE